MEALTFCSKFIYSARPALRVALDVTQAKRALLKADFWVDQGGEPGMRRDDLDDTDLQLQYVDPRPGLESG